MKPSLTLLVDLLGLDHFAKAKRVAREQWGISAGNFLLDFVTLFKHSWKCTITPRKSPTDLMQAVQAMHEMQNLAVMQSPSL